MRNKQDTAILSDSQETILAFDSHVIKSKCKTAPRQIIKQNTKSISSTISSQQISGAKL